jgi:gamma-glutamyltranspeptidase
MFCLFYDATSKKVHALNGSGRSTANLDLAGLRKELNIMAGQNGFVDYLSPQAVTVPGAAAGWVDTVQKFGSGKLSLEQILTPAIELAEEGFPISEYSAQMVCLLLDIASLSKLASSHRWRHSGQMVNLSYATHPPIFENYSKATRWTSMLSVLRRLGR